MRRALVEHNYCCIKTKELNQTFNYVIFMIYFFAKPVINILVYAAQGKDTPTFTRIAATNISVGLMFIMFSGNMLFVSVSTWVHKPLKPMYKLFKEKKFETMHKLKALGFIEKLRGPVIGFYCYEFYPLNNYQFCLSILDWAANYFLITNLISDMKLSF